MLPDDKRGLLFRLRASVTHTDFEERTLAMSVRAILFAFASVIFAMPALAANTVERAPPGGDYKKINELTKLPDFLPSLGMLYVDPKTLPTGPYLAYDRDGRLVSTVYMIPDKDITAKKRLDGLDAPGGRVDHVNMYHSGGHPGVEDPHYHVVLWHVAKADEARVAR